MNRKWRKRGRKERRKEGRKKISAMIDDDDQIKSNQIYEY